MDSYEKFKKLLLNNVEGKIWNVCDTVFCANTSPKNKPHTGGNILGLVLLV